MSRMIKVWDVPTRLFHWTMVPVFAGLWFTAEQGGDWMEWHLRLGMLMLVLVLFRVLWGLCGSQTARFGNFLAGPARILAYLAGQLPVTAQPGHNPLGGWMVLALLLALLLQAGLGLFAADVNSYLYDGPLKVLIDGDLAEQITGWHKDWFDVLLLLAAVHVLAVAFYKVGRNTDLVRPMFSGMKALPGEVAPLRFASPWRALVLLLLVALLVFGGVPWLAASVAA
ncbi:cytochrome b/b6 domain-containing protein [Vogesella sp. LYT5W]|uniref:Cytochrome b/b6 domain-containing protein n=1 Tax=Vogesella margarita TaxID=2984199 RepID=A0ABT5INP3_9NEIS|nr:cytochrome b/b6 domain-containing protein [Vogesella margarita]MDC7714147.1 cytochrome b/b6 domain-containing protein [Vogesella margarita]